MKKKWSLVRTGMRLEMQKTLKIMRACCAAVKIAHIFDQELTESAVCVLPVALSASYTTTPQLYVCAPKRAATFVLHVDTNQKCGGSSSSSIVLTWASHWKWTVEAEDVNNSRHLPWEYNDVHLILQSFIYFFYFFFLRKETFKFCSTYLQWWICWKGTIPPECQSV